MLEIVILDGPRLPTTPSIALCIHAVTIAHTRAQYYFPSSNLLFCGY